VKQVFGMHFKNNQTMKKKLLFTMHVKRIELNKY
jgi:hypothetical protein